MQRVNERTFLGLVMVGLLMLAGCGLKSPTVAVDLPEAYNTPDGMTVDARNNIILSCPNFNDTKFPARLAKIGPNDELSELLTLPVHPETGKAGPMGLDVGSDGNIYIADNQAFDTEAHKSRLLRVVMKDGKAVRCEVVVVGFIMSNAVSCHGDSVYVTETKLDPKADPLPSGVYRFKISELNAAAPVKLLPGGKDKHLITTIYTKSKEWPIGANGLAFDAKGNMFFCNFGDAQLIKATFDSNGKVASQTVFAEGSGMKCCDGMKIDPKTGDIYIADFLGNAVHKVDSVTGKVTTIARNGNTDGAGGALDRPSEVCVRGNRLYVSNIDLSFAGNTYDKPHTISVIELDVP